jgi:hypothetical protein
VKQFHTIHKQSQPLVRNLGKNPSKDVSQLSQQREARIERHQNILLSSKAIASPSRAVGTLLGLDVDVGATAALVAFSSNDLVVVLAKVETESGPGVEVVLHGDATTDTLALADRPVLLEGAGTIDGGLVGAGRDVDVVVAAVGGEASLVLSTAAGVVGSEGFNHIVLDQRRAGPAIDSKVSVALGAEASTVVDGAWSRVRSCLI